MVQIRVTRKMIKVASPLAKAEWREDEHPRKGGKFAPKGEGETGGTKAEAAPATERAPEGKPAASMQHSIPKEKAQPPTDKIAPVPGNLTPAAELGHAFSSAVRVSAADGRPVYIDKKPDGKPFVTRTRPEGDSYSRVTATYSPDAGYAVTVDRFSGKGAEAVAEPDDEGPDEDYPDKYKDTGPAMPYQGKNPPYTGKNPYETVQYDEEETYVAPPGDDLYNNDIVSYKGKEYSLASKSGGKATLHPLTENGPVTDGAITVDDMSQLSGTGKRVKYDTVDKILFALKNNPNDTVEIDAKQFISEVHRQGQMMATKGKLSPANKKRLNDLFRTNEELLSGITPAQRAEQVQRAQQALDILNGIESGAKPKQPPAPATPPQQPPAAAQQQAPAEAEAKPAEGPKETPHPKTHMESYGGKLKTGNSQSDYRAVGTPVAFASQFHFREPTKVVYVTPTTTGTDKQKAYANGLKHTAMSTVDQHYTDRVNRFHDDPVKAAKERNELLEAIDAETDSRKIIDALKNDPRDSKAIGTFRPKPSP